MKFGTVSTGRYTGADRYTGVAVGRRSTVYDCNHGINVYMVDRFIVYVFYIRFSMSGSICSDGTSRFVYLQSNFYRYSYTSQLHFRTYIAFIVSGYSCYVNMLVTRLKSDMCLVFLLHN